MAKWDHGYLALSCSQHDAHGGRRFVLNTNAHADPNSDVKSNSDSYFNSNSNSDRYGNSDCYSNTNSNDDS